VERGQRQLWFFADLRTDFVRGIGVGQTCMFVWQQKDLQACLGGRLAVRQNRSRIDRYWNAVVAAGIRRAAAIRA
jgi:general stress protein 26